MTKIIVRGQKIQDQRCLFPMFFMALRNAKAVAIAPNGVNAKAGIKASSSPGPLQPCWRQ